VPLCGADGATVRLQVLPTDGSVCAVRWTQRIAADEKYTGETVSLRTVIGRLEAYEPALSMTAAAIRRHEQSECSTCALRGELMRVVESPIVLNRRLRERVEQAVAREGLRMSEIAIRCGRVKRDRRGNESRETSWLARRLGQLPEGGKHHATPWVHSDVLALIARDGLGIGPCEAEL
jgi:hypothetical protein